MATEDIERLKEKLDKDPDSKLFVPLAEEYKKAGMLDEAIDVLTKGLENQPTYLSARVSLGKIYIEKGMLDEARTEFEKVISVIPDNLYAHKKLAEIYKDRGQKEEAIKEFKTVLRLNPMDEWAATSLSSIGEETAYSQVSSEKELKELPSAEKEAAEAFPVQEERLETGLETPSDSFMTARDTELSKMISEESVKESGQEEEPPEISPGTEETETWGGPSESAGIKGKEVTLPKAAISEEDMELWRTHLETVEEVDLKSEEGEEEVEPIGVEELLEEEPISFEDILKEPEAAVRGEPVEEPVFPAKPISRQSVDDADKWISQGKYGEAMSIYRTILSGDPGNKQALQRVEELRALLKLLGKDKEELIKTLEGFLEAIKKRRDEFSGTA